MASFDSIHNFETLIANYYGAAYGIATDSCTHAIELALRYDSVRETTCPNHTYLSIPMTLMKIGINWKWNTKKWEYYYFLSNTRIIDAAVLWKKKSYIPNTLMCLSFQFKKHLSVGRGGMILTDDLNEYLSLKAMSYDGRNFDIPWMNQDIPHIGYHYYMTPESAEYGIQQFYKVVNKPPEKKGYYDYPNLSNLKVFND